MSKSSSSLKPTSIALAAAACLAIAVTTTEGQFGFNTGFNNNANTNVRPVAPAVAPTAIAAPGSIAVGDTALRAVTNGPSPSNPLILSAPAAFNPPRFTPIPPPTAGPVPDTQPLTATVSVAPVSGLPSVDSLFATSPPLIQTQPATQPIFRNSPGPVIISTPVQTNPAAIPGQGDDASVSRSDNDMASNNAQFDELLNPLHIRIFPEEVATSTLDLSILGPNGGNVNGQPNFGGSNTGFVDPVTGQFIPIQPTISPINAPGQPPGQPPGPGRPPVDPHFIGSGVNNAADGPNPSLSFNPSTFQPTNDVDFINPAAVSFARVSSPIDIGTLSNEIRTLNWNFRNQGRNNHVEF